MKNIKFIFLALLLCVCMVFTAVACKPTEPQHEHSYGEWQTVKEADCTNKGEKKRVCSGCNDEQVEEIAPLGHDFRDTYVGDANSHWRVCSRCNVSDSKSEHVYVDGKCTLCDRLEPTASLAYNKIEGGYEVVGFLEGESDTNIVVAEEINGEPVIAIAKSAFSSKPIVSVVLPDSIKNIGNQAFYACASLKKFHMGNSVESVGDFAFQQAGISDMTISQSLKEIGQYAFSVMPNLTNVVIPATVEKVGKYAFYASGLQRVDIRGTVIGDGMFRACSSLSSIKFNDDMTEIPNTYAFRECTSLVKVTLPKSLIKLGSCAFYNCTALEEVVMAPALEVIGDRAFYSTAISSIELPQTLKEIKGYAFQYCKSLETVNIPAGVVGIGTYSFAGSGLKNAVINSAVISDRAFSNCVSLESIKLGASVRWIETRAFDGCTSLTNVDMKEKSEIGLDIREYAFNNCTSLQSITLNAGVFGIRPYVFNGCSALTSVEFITEADTQWYTLKVINDTYDYTIQAFDKEELEPTLIDVSNPQANATALKNNTSLLWRNRAIVYNPIYPKY